VAPGDKGAAEREKSFVDVRVAFLAQSEAAEAMQPGQGAFDNPAEDAEAAAMRTAGLGGPGRRRRHGRRERAHRDLEIAARFPLIAAGRLRDAQPANLVLQRRTLQSQKFGGSPLACDASRCSSQCADDYRGLCLSKRRGRSDSNIGLG